MSLASFQELPFWYNEVKRNVPDSTIYLVGTKGEEPDGIQFYILQIAYFVAMVVKVQDILKLVNLALELLTILI